MEVYNAHWAHVRRGCTPGSEALRVSEVPRKVKLERR